MLPLELLPGHQSWGHRLPALLEHAGPLWIFGEAGAGVTSFLHWVADRRGTACLDDAEGLDAVRLTGFLDAHPRGALGGHLALESAPFLPLTCLAFRLPSLEEDPRCLPGLVEHLARLESVDGPLPSALWSLPCPGNLQGLRNRLLRWKLLGQLPAPPEGGTLPLEAEDLATNLHALERILLHRVLRRSYGNRVEAAARLGVSRRQLYLLVARHGDPVRGEGPQAEGPKRLLKQKNRQNSSRREDGR